MLFRTVLLSPDESDDLRAGLSLARIRWRLNLEKGDTGPWATYSAESMRLSADLYHVPDSGGVLHCSMHSVSCVTAAAYACLSNSNSDIAGFASSLFQIAIRIREAFDESVVADRVESPAVKNAHNSDSTDHAVNR